MDIANPGTVRLHLTLEELSAVCVLAGLRGAYVGRRDAATLTRELMTAMRRSGLALKGDRLCVE